MFFLPKDPFSILVIILIALQVFALLIFLIFYFSSKRKEKQSLLHPLVKQFEKQLNILMEEEFKKIIFKLNENVEIFTKELIEAYKKEVSLLPTKIEEQFAKINKFNELIENKIFQETEKNIKELNQTYLEGQKFLFQEVKNKTEELNKNITEEIHWLYQETLKPLNERVLEVERDLENYKKEKIKEIDKNIYQIIIHATKKIIGQSIDLSLHEKLVIEALEKAKKEKFF